MKRIIVFLFFLSVSLCLKAATITSLAVTGNWNSATSWVGGVVPGINDNVIIANGANITVNTNSTAYNLRINSGGVLNLGSRVLRLMGNGTDNGSMTIYGTLNLNTGTLELTGDFFTGTSASAGTFNSGTGTVNFIGNAHQMISGHTIPVFYNLVTSNVNNTQNNGVTAHPVNTIIKGNFTANGVFNRGSLGNYPVKVTFDGNTTLSGLYSFFLHNVEINPGATLNATNKTIYLYGNWANNGTFICGTSTLWLTYDPSHPSQSNQTIRNINAQTNPFYNLSINKSTGSVTPTTHPTDTQNPNGHFWVNGDFTMNNGTWTNGNRNLTVKKDFIVNAGTFNSGQGRVILDGQTQQLLKTTGSTLYALTVDNPQGIMLVSDVNISNNLNLTTGHIFTTNAYEVHVSTNNIAAIQYNANSFIVGKLRRAVGSGAANYVFPIGPMNTASLKYRPITYEQTSANGATSIVMIQDTISWNGQNTANWFANITSNAGTPNGNFLFTYNLNADFSSNVNECAISVSRGVNPQPANWNFVLNTVLGASGGTNGSTRVAIPSALAPNNFILGEAIPQLNNIGICFGNTAQLSVIAPTGSGGFNWYNAATGGILLSANTNPYTTPVLNNTTTYYVSHVNSTTSCIGNYRRPVTVNVGANINVNIIPSGSTAFCGSTSLTLNAGLGYASYSWSNGSNQQIITVTQPNTYTVSVTDGGGCSGTGSIVLTSAALPSNATSISGPASLCTGTTVTYTVPAVNGATHYQWTVPTGFSITSGQGTNTINVVAYSASTGTIMVTPYNTCGNGGSATITVTNNAYPATPQSISGPSHVCAGATATYSIPYVTGATGYNWYVSPTASIVSGANTNSIVVDWGNATTGIVTVTPYSNCGNGTPTSMYVIISEFPLPIVGGITGPLSVCLGEMVNYQVFPVGNATGYLWEVPPGISILGGQNSSVITINWQYLQSGYIKVSPTNACGTGQKDSVFVSVLPVPNIPNFHHTFYSCGGNAIVIKPNVPVNGTLNWYSQSQGGTAFHSGDSLYIGQVSGNQTIWVDAQSVNGCTNLGGRVKIEIVVLPYIPVDITSDLVNNTGVLGQTITFTAHPAGFAHYEFYVNGQSVQIGTSPHFVTSDLKNNDVVTVVATDYHGCTHWAQTEITVKINSYINAFTPNGDGINDIFMKGYDLVILNRWSQVLYKGFEGWDGKYNGTYVSPGTYYFIVTSVAEGQDITKRYGAVQVSR